MLAGWTFPILYKKDDRPQWAVPSATGSDAQRASFYGDQIRAEIDATGPDRLVLERTFQTQSIDQVFMEPEAGLAWYDSGARKLELVIGVQSPQQAAASVATLVSKNAADQAVGTIVAHCAYVGGAFGGKDHTIYPLYVALAGLFSPDRPVRLANDRYDQFQFGIKRHAFGTRSRMAVDRASGRITAFAADQDLDGGGLANLSSAVAFVGATASIGIYDVPKVDVTTVARHSRAVTAGSMRGFGALQTMTALEVLIDEAAARLGHDPVAFRKANLLKTGGKTMVGNVISGALRSGEVLDRLASKPLWTGRAAEKARRAATASEQSLWRRPRLRQHRVRQRLRSGLRAGRDRSRRPHHPHLAGGRDRHRDRDRARGARGRQARGRRRRGEARRARRLGRARADRAGRSVHDHRASSRTRRRRTRAGFPTSRRTPPPRSRPTSTPRSPPRRRTSSCASASGRRRKAIWSAGRFGGQAAGELVRFEDVRFVDGRLTADGHGAARAPAPRRQGARDGPRRRGDGARLQSLGLGARHLRSSRRPLRGRDRRARGEIRQRRGAGAQGADDDAAAISASTASR